ncbi:MAG: hypothetical protein O3C51_04620 [Planctomycetota bacterium]|nr:hypothetical protein [Planctomycetota bacterium]MDA1221625.1 hypothetical protein [Planctomycetota bacterium]
MKAAHDVFRGLRARARTGILIEGAARLACVLAGFVVLSYGIDRWLELERPYRFGVLCVAIAGIAVTWRRHVARPLTVDLDDAELALAVERSDSGLRQVLISAVEFERDLERGAVRGQSDTLMQSVVADATARLGQIDAVRALDARRTALFGGGLAAALAWIVLFLSLVAEPGVWAQRNLLLGAVSWPRETRLAFATTADGDREIRLAEREDLVLRVEVEGVVPDEVELVATFAGGERATRRMDRVGPASFTTTLTAVLEDVELVAMGGDGASELLRVRIVERPRVLELEVAIHAPVYVGGEPLRTTEVGGTLDVTAGGRVEVRAKSSKELRAARLRYGDGEPRAIEVADDRVTVVGSANPEEDGILRIEFVDADDLGPAQPPQIALRVVPDTVPIVEFESEGIGSLITAEARIPGLLRITDDHGVATVSALGRTMDATAADEEAAAFDAVAVEWAGPLLAGASEQELGLVFDLKPLLVDPDPDSLGNPIHPGLLLSLRFDATDGKEPDPQTGTSEVRTFRVVTREKLLQELRRRQEEQRRELERILTRVEDARTEIEEVLSPASTDPAADRARLRMRTLARQLNGLGAETGVTAERYAAILDEYSNNRLYEPNIVRASFARVVDPLREIAGSGFPPAAQRTAAFAERGGDEDRAGAVQGLADVVAALRRVLAQMEKNESLSELVETLRIVIRTEEELQRELERLAEAEGAGIFGDDPEPGAGGKRKQ